MKKTITFFTMFLALLFAANCFAADFTNEGMTLSIPDETAKQLKVETPENDPEGVLFTVSEQASIDAAAASGDNWSGAGWLFAISRVSEEKMHELLCQDMSGKEVFAKGADGSRYLFCHPTDVRFVRADYSDESQWQVWSALTGWAGTVPETFISGNPGLTPETHGNSLLDIQFARMMYRDDVHYTVSTTEFGPIESGRVKAADYIQPLTENVVYEYVDDEEAPDGEYVVLDFPEEDLRFDFFLQEGKENYIRQIWNDNNNSSLYKAVFADKSIKASAVMNDFYKDMVLADSLGYGPDSLVGAWAEKIAGRGVIYIEKNPEGTYSVSIHWGSSAYESADWAMTAVPTGSGAELRYEDGVKTILTFTSETESTEKTIYTDGKGTFTLLSTHELMWNDETEHAADYAVFVFAGD